MKKHRWLSLAYTSPQSEEWATQITGETGLDIRMQYTLPISLCATASENNPGPLTNANLALLNLLALGKTAKQAAEILHLSPRTVFLRIETLREKLGAKTDQEMIARGFRLGLLK